MIGYRILSRFPEYRRGKELVVAHHEWYAGGGYPTGGPTRDRQVSDNVLRSQSNPDEIWLMVGFEDEASYRSNADDPETDKMAQEYQQLMAAPPEWHDGEIVAMTQAENAAGV